MTQNKWKHEAHHGQMVEQFDSETETRAKVESADWNIQYLLLKNVSIH